MEEQHADFNKEEQHLAQTRAEMQEIIAQLQHDIDDRFNRRQNALAIKDEVSAYVHAMLRGDNSKKIFDLDNALANPYFGRVDFKEDGTDEFLPFYIGRCKAARLEINGPADILVFDWRDPVATVFYECYDGRASYSVMDRYHYSGAVSLKRQYKIAQGQLQAVMDNYILNQVLNRQEEALLADPALRERLREGAADKLKDIITSIQAEQNKIIREPLNQVTVIQGVAGSGKSTIGLHRLSFLLYNGKLNPEKLIVIAPNRIFLDYISELLPEIDAADVKQMVWDDLAAAITQQTWNVAADKRLEMILSGEDRTAVKLLEDTARLKGSLDFIQILENYVEQKARAFCLKLEDISLFAGVLTITAREQLNQFMEAAASPYRERLEMLGRFVNFKVNNYLDVMQARFEKGKGTEEELKRCRKEAATFLKKHAKSWHAPSLLDAYRDVFNKKGIFKPVKDTNYDLDAIRRHSQAVFDAGQVEREDLAPLAYLAMLLNGWSHMDRFDHMVIDEAQDLNALEFVVLKRLSANGSFTIMGDLSQGIHSYRSIASWNVVIKEVFADAKAEYREILHSYRSAKEIIDIFNRVMPQGHSRAIPVYEIGRKPTAEKIRSFAHGVKRTAAMLDLFMERGAKSIAVITKLERQAVELYAALKAERAETECELPLCLVSGDGATYRGGISVLPVALAKGLEFDGVIVWDASEEAFKDTPFDARLLYVALSRAMHNLHILYQGEMTPLLRKRRGN
ncbi:HelD family protein [Azotosporobacter soli]|uniref:HelD family protein n=1 Tax=Azotosporobacter soli TaxID=3055040 RepID=UPI0031FE8219